MDSSLSGQVAFVTGGGRGLGQAIAQCLATAGAHVVIAARNKAQLDETKALITQAGGHVHAFELDVTDQSAVKQVISDVEHLVDPIDLLINNAGIGEPLGPIWEVDADAWWQCLNVNLRGVFLCTQAVLPHMIGRHRGRIINMASAASLRAFAYASAYVVSKTALVRFTENLAVETQQHGISAFAIEPGTIRTALTEYLYGSDAGRKWTPWFQKVFDEGRDVSTERMTELILELASGKGDALSGCMLSIYDDFDALIQQKEAIERDKLYTLRRVTSIS